MSPPAFNASLNFASAVLLGTGYAMIRKGRVRPHQACMLAAFFASSVFLVSYLTYHWHAGHVRYAGRGWMRGIYLAILLSHTVLAVAIVPLAIRTLYLAMAGRFDAHRRIARWALPLWFYVSVTGVIIYEMLY